MGCETILYMKASFPKETGLMNVPTSAPVVATVNRIKRRSVTQIISLQTSSSFSGAHSTVHKKDFSRFKRSAGTVTFDLSASGCCRRTPKREGAQRFWDLRAGLPGLLKHLGQSTLISLWRTLRFEAVSSGVVHKERHGGKINYPQTPDLFPLPPLTRLSLAVWALWPSEGLQKKLISKNLRILRGAVLGSGRLLSTT